jgi:hypothetical protein
VRKLQINLTRLTGLVFSQKKEWIVALTCSTRWYGAASCGSRKLPWITGELSCLKNKKTKAAKRLKASEKQGLEDETIDDCECEQLRGEFLSL